MEFIDFNIVAEAVYKRVLLKILINLFFEGKNVENFRKIKINF